MEAGKINVANEPKEAAGLVLVRPFCAVSFAFGAILAVAQVVWMLLALLAGQYWLFAYCCLVLPCVTIAFISMGGTPQIWLALKRINQILFGVITVITVLFVSMAVTASVNIRNSHATTEEETNVRNEKLEEVYGFIQVLVLDYLLLLGVYIPLFYLHQPLKPDEKKLASVDTLVRYGPTYTFSLPFRAVSHLLL